MPCFQCNYEIRDTSQKILASDTVLLEAATVKLARERAAKHGKETAIRRYRDKKAAVKVTNVRFSRFG